MCRCSVCASVLVAVFLVLACSSLLHRLASHVYTSEPPPLWDDFVRPLNLASFCLISK
eukprot:m.230837 g.230837  ORF g.230837 m.230837 type:complete len:58 (-) comp10869_c3_seq1:24-197(-)